MSRFLHRRDKAAIGTDSAGPDQRPGSPRRHFAHLPLLVVLLGLLSALLTAVSASAEPVCDGPNPPPVCESDPPPPPRGAPTGTLATATRLPTGIQVSGTARDPDAAGPVTVRIYASGSYRGSLQTTDGSYLGTVPVAGRSREVCAVAVNRNQGHDADIGCRSLNVTVNPYGSLDAVTVTPGRDSVRVAGWAIDPDTTAPITVHIYVDSAGRAVTASTSRPDVATAYPLYGPAHGFDTTIAATHGTHTVCAYAINTGPGDTNTGLGCTTVTVTSRTVMRVMTFNIQGGRNEAGQMNLAAQAAFIRSQSPDVVMLQEVHDNARESGHVNQTEELRRLTGMGYATFAGFPYQGGKMGNAILSKYPLSEITVTNIPKPPNWWLDPGNWKYNRENRNIVAASATVNGVKHRFYTVHLSHMWDYLHAKNIEVLADLVGQLPASTIPVVGGDFNVTSDYPPLSQLSNLANAFTVSGGTGADGENGGIDLVFYGRNGSYTSTWARAATVLSDHDAIVVQLTR